MPHILQQLRHLVIPCVCGQLVRQDPSVIGYPRVASVAKEDLGEFQPRLRHAPLLSLPDDVHLCRPRVLRHLVQSRASWE